MPEDPSPSSRPDDASSDEPPSEAASEGRAPEAAETPEERAETPEPIDMLQPLFREKPLRPEGGEAPTTWLWMVVFGVLLFSVFYLGTYMGDFSPDPWLQSSQPVAQATTPDPAEETVNGANIYSSRCANCHQADGEGVANAFPPLTRARWVEDKGQIIRILLHGMQGPVEVRGSTYNGNMPAWGNILSDREIAAVITHVRQSWGNDHSEVTAEEITAVRSATEGQAQPWTAQELNQDENRTVPGPSEPTAASPATIGAQLYAQLTRTPVSPSSPSSDGFER